MNIIYHETGKDEHFKIWHASPMDKNMIIYMYSNGGSIVCKENIYPIRRGVLCFVGAGKYHYTMPDVPELYDRSKLFFSTDTLNKLLGLISDGKHFSGFAADSLIYAEIPKQSQKEAEDIFKEMADSDGTAYQEATRLSCLLRLLMLIDRYSIESTLPASGSLGSAIEYINKNIFREISIDDICAAVHISKYHFCRRFKQNLGITVMNYILKTRITLAKSMLEKENASVTEVSDRCGFSSLSYFCRVFKAETGMSPLKFRKK